MRIISLFLLVIVVGIIGYMTIEQWSFLDALYMTVEEGLECCGAIAILAVKKKDGLLLTNPSNDTQLELGDELVIIGTREQLRVVEGTI